MAAVCGWDGLDIHPTGHFPPAVTRLRYLLLGLMFFLTEQAAHASADSVVVFNEIQYHPASASQTEWIELHSLQGVAVDLSGWQLAGGVAFTFPAGTVIAGNGFLVVAASPGALPGAGALGPWSGKLDNAGEEIRLANNSGRTMDRVSYGDGSEWPAGPDGSGATLAKTDQESADSGPGHWSSSPTLGGSPATANFPIPGSPPVMTTRIAIGDTWKYRDDNVALAGSWKDRTEDDSGWPSGAALFHAGSPHIGTAGDGLSGYWPLEETSGSSAPNLAAGGTAGTLVNGASWVTDATRGQVLNFDGVDGYVSAGLIPQMTLANDFTWSFWASSEQTGTNVVVGNRFAASGAESTPREFVKFTSQAFEFHRNGSGEDIDYADLPLGTWIHHAIVKQGSTLTYYRNGVATGTRPITLGLNSPQPFYFGGDQTEENWVGRLDDIATWTKALPAASVAGLAAGALTPLTAPTSADGGTSSGTLATAVAQGPSTHYFRRAFTFNGAKERTVLTLQHLLDDGAVFYLNGTEVLRVNLPGGTIGHATLASTDIATATLSTAVAISSAALMNGTNVLAVEVHQASPGAPANDLVFGAILTAAESPAPARIPGGGVVFNEISAAGDPQFQIELSNLGNVVVDLADYQITSSSGASVTLGPQSLAAGGVATFTAAQLGFAPLDGDRLFLLQPGGTEYEDGRQVTNRLRGRAPDGSWRFPSTTSFGAANAFALHTGIAINEIMFSPHPNQTAQEQWVELFNRSTESVDLSGWQFAEGVGFTFPVGTTLAPGQFLVVADDPAGFATHHPGVTALGPWTGKLAGKGERLVLIDAFGNPADEIRYYDDGRWPDLAGGGGSSLERRDPLADSAAPESWAASDEGSRSQWQTVSYSGSGANLGSDPTKWNEFVFGLLGKGSFLIDDISVKQDPGSLNTQLIQNRNFSLGTTNYWRLLGTHSHATVVDDPSTSGNKVLRIDASGAAGHMHNHAETTLKNGGSFVTINAGKNYEISFRARWLGGCNLLNTRLYFNRLARTTALAVTAAGGTPGAANSRALANLGPSYHGLSHSPAVPAAGATATVSVRPSDPDELGTLTLYFAVDGGAFATVSMDDADGSGLFTGTVPAQSAGAKVQFYVRATDALGATSFFPAGGANSRAIIPWADGLTGSGPGANLRITMLTSDSDAMHEAVNSMSDDERGATVIYRENDIYYDVGTRLKGSERGRSVDVRVGWHLRFAPHQPFLGAHPTIAIDRSGAGNQFSQKEILIGHALNHAGNIPGSYDDLIRVIAPRIQHTGPAMLQKARFSDEFLDNQWANGAAGTAFEYELIYYPTSTNTGGVEGLKLPQPDNTAGASVASLGTTKEAYRWHYLIKNNRQSDDYSALIPAVTAMGLSSGPQFIADTTTQLDVDQWLRSFAIQVLFGINDSYSNGGQHNAVFYTRPSDGKTLYFPKDMDFTFATGATSSITQSGDLAKLVTDAANRRAYYGHLLDIIHTSFNSAYMTPWAQHYTTFLPSEDLGTYMSYIDLRASSVQDQIKAGIVPVPFAITTHGGQPFSVATPYATIAGTGWVDVREIRLVSSIEPLAITWTGASTWQVSVPLASGVNLITLQALDFDGALLGTASITITNSGPTLPASAGNLAITEMMYHPALPSAAEQAAGYNYLGAEDEFEWIEVRNISNSNVDLTGARFTAGFDYTFGSRILSPGEHLVVARNLSAFTLRYPAVATGRRVGPFTSGKLSDSGETITLLDAGGGVIRSFTYADSTPWPATADGAGSSLVRIGLEDPTRDSLPEAWRRSTALNGSPATGDGLDFDTWKTANGITSDTGDLDDDGLSNFVEYVHGTDPRGSDGAQVATRFEPDGHLTLWYTRRLGADDVAFELQTATDLTAWSPAASGFSYQGAAFHSEGIETVTYRTATPVASDSGRLYRLRLSR